MLPYEYEGIVNSAIVLVMKDWEKTAEINAVDSIKIVVVFFIFSILVFSTKIYSLSHYRPTPCVGYLRDYRVEDFVQISVLEFK